MQVRSVFFERDRPLVGLLAASLVVAVVSLFAFGPGVDRASSQEACDPGYDTTHILVRMEPDASAEALGAMKALNGDGIEYESAGLERLWIVALPTGMAVPEAVALYGVAEGVAYAEPDHKIYPEGYPQDTCEATGSAPYVRLTDSPNPVRAGATLTYEATVTNSGPQAAKAVTLLTGAPEDASLLSSGFANGEASGPCPPGENGLIRCQIGDVPVGGSATVRLEVRPTRAGILSQSASVYASNGGTTIEPVASTRTEVLPAHRTKVGVCTILGGADRDVFAGTPDRDVICGLGGNDVLDGKGGDDVVVGGVGGDVLVGRAGGDRLLGSDGSATLRARDGVEGNDVARGGDGNDEIFADAGDDTLASD